MSDKVFVDSNVIIYAHTDFQPSKQLAAQQIIIDKYTVVSSQVLNGTANILRKKFKQNWSDIAVVVKEITENNALYVNDDETTLRACSVADRYGFSFYDSLIVAAALISKCSVLYSEDLQDGQQIEYLTVANPFHD